MIKLICIKNKIPKTPKDSGDYTEYLTIGKTYEYDENFDSSVLFRSEKDKLILIIDDIGQKHYISKEMFVPLNEWRDKQLKQLGI